MKKSAITELTWDNQPEVAGTDRLLLLCVYRKSDYRSHVWMRTLERFARENADAVSVARADLDSGAFRLSPVFNVGAGAPPEEPYLLAFMNNTPLPLRLDGVKHGGYATLEAVEDFTREARRRAADMRRGRPIVLYRNLNLN